MGSLRFLVYFVPSSVILIVAVILLVYCRRKCVSDRAAEGEVRRDPNNLEPPADVPEWVTSPRLLCHHYYINSQFSLCRETTRRYFPSRRLDDGPVEEIELGVV